MSDKQARVKALRRRLMRHNAPTFPNLAKLTEGQLEALEGALGALFTSGRQEEAATATVTRNPQAFHVDDRTGDPLYLRAADSLCYACGEVIGARLFRVEFCEEHGFDLFVHRDCSPEVDPPDEE